MTAEEAIKGLKVLAKDFSGYKPNEKMFEMTISALEKQIQKKPTTRIDDYCENLYRMYCPTCGNSIGRGNKRVGYVVRQYEGQKCCGVCGQQIEWPKQWL